MSKSRKHWRSLELPADSNKMDRNLKVEFPEHAWERDNSMSRRNFISLMGASLAMASLAGCRRPVEKIVPYVSQPEVIVPGVAQHYATTMPFGLSAYGLVVETHEGRPTKIEGNPLHPSTLGTANAMVQGSILGLYDPDRSQVVMQNGTGKGWADFVAFWRELYDDYVQNKGEGLAVLMQPFASPTMAKLAADFRTQFPKARLAAWEPVNDENIYKGIAATTGMIYQPVYHFDKTRVILSLDCDFLQTESENISAMYGYANGRRLTSEKDAMNRLYVIESNFSLTGGMADHRLRMPCGNIGIFTLALAKRLDELGVKHGVNLGNDLTGFAVDDKWVEAVARDLAEAVNGILIVAGRKQPPYVHALALALNKALGSVGNTVDYHRSIDVEYPTSEGLASLVDSMNRKEVSTLLIIGGNPVYDTPADMRFISALEQVAHTIQLSQYNDETSLKVEWHVPEAHYLETWGDARAVDGTISIIQPMIAPLYGGHSAVEVLNIAVTGTDRQGYDLVRERWADILKEKDTEAEWKKALHEGILEGSSIPGEMININSEAIGAYIAQAIKDRQPPDAENLEVVFTSSPSLHDGRFANNGWLQELPDSMTKLTWDNPALISWKTADQLGVESGDMIRLEWQGKSMETAIWVMPGQADYSITLVLGYGRTSAGRVGNNVGFNTYQLRRMAAGDFGNGLKISKTGNKYKLSTTQDHQEMEGRPLIRENTIANYRKDPNFATEMVKLPPLESIFTEHKYDRGYQWGMVIDLNACTGCNACTIACQSENNVPIVGKEQVSRGREMHWIRIDRYFVGDADEPETLHQPVACQQCENAPCETVCPVAATVHSKEGLNMMTYNRCIGTRYCSNNCPYKVRRFNFFNYTNSYSQTIKMMQNPEVTVRFRGVMEKCTFCIQRIERARSKAKLEGREMRDGEIIPACAQTCPAQAIVFGNLNDPKSRVSQIKKQNRNYLILAELNTKPRNSYLARIRNPNPALEEARSPRKWRHISGLDNL